MKQIKISKYTIEKRADDSGWDIITYISSSSKELESSYFISNSEIIDDDIIATFSSIKKNIDGNSIKNFMNN